MAFNEKEYTDWLKIKGWTKLTSPEERQAARDTFVKEVILPKSVGDDGQLDIDLLNANINDFNKARPLQKLTMIDVQSIIDNYNPTPFSGSDDVPSAPLIGGSPSSVSTGEGAGAQPSQSVLDELAKKIQNKSDKKAIEDAISTNKSNKIERGIDIGTGVLKAGAGIGQYLSGKKQMKGLKIPKDVTYNPLKELDTEIAKAQGLAETGDVPLIELGRREIANEKALADTQARMASSGDISAYGAGAQANSIAAMNAQRKLLADIQQQKRADRQVLQGMLGQKAQQEQFKAQIDDANRNQNVAEYIRKGNRAQDILGAGVSNIATGFRDIKDAGVSLAISPNLQSQLENFELLDEQTQTELAQKYPSIFGKRVVKTTIPTIPQQKLTKEQQFMQNSPYVNLPNKAPFKFYQTKPPYRY